ncbi:peroxisome targeting signal receptor [Abortiporus biennis]|nr:peroxisome targeting signal receptor [Abortiporus biennis]
MSLQGLISGSECAVPFNPLSQVLKHAEGDRSLQQDRVAGPSSSRLQHLPSTSAAPASQRDIELARQFFDANGPGPSVGAGPAFAAPQHLPPAEMLMRENSRMGTPDLNKAWIESQQPRQFIPNAQGPSMSAGWANEFTPGPSSLVEALAQHTMTQGPETFQPSYMQGRMYGGGMMPMNMSMYSNFSPPLEMSDKGKGKSRDVDFEAAFAEFDKSLASTNQAQSARIEEVNDSLEQLENAMKDATLKDEEGTPDFKAVWDQLQNSDIPPPNEDITKWEAEYNQLMSNYREGLDYGEAMQDAWEGGLGNLDDNENTVQFDDEGLPILGEYVYEKENKYLDPSTSTDSPLDAAKALLAQNGSLTEAALLLEAAIQKGQLGTGGYEAWILLGEVRSMDEREEQAMRALMEGVKIAEQAGAAGEGMLSLAISFTNESHERASHTMLLRWLSSRYPSHPISPATWKSLTESTWHSHELVTETFLNLAREQHVAGQLDPDVQIGLGVLFYTNSQFDRAKDCFEAALSVRPDDYLLWNRLGSSLSNGDHPEEALGAYREALRIRPTYTRAIYNVGVACLNIGAHKEAAEHFLSALAMQDSSAGAKSEQLWFTLRRALLSMDRSDLAGIANTSTPLDTFRKEGFDF